MDPSAEEALWIHQSCHGDPEAFEALVARHQRMVYSVIQRMVGSPTDAEDLAQEVFIQAYQHLGQYRNEAKFATWLCRIAINRCLNWRERQHRHDSLFERWSQEQERAFHDTNSEADARQQQVQSAVAQLHPKQRAAIVLTVYEDLSHAEAARVLGCSESTVSWRVFSARRKLKRWLKPCLLPAAGSHQQRTAERREILS